MVELWTEENLARYGDLFINGDEPTLIVKKIDLDEENFKRSNYNLHSLPEFLPGCQGIRKLEI